MSTERRPPCPKCRNPEPTISEYGPGCVARKYTCWHCGAKFRPTLKGISVLWQPVGELQGRLMFPLELQEAGG